MSEKRGTGRTTRQLEACIDRAVAGEAIVYVVATRTCVEMYSALAQQICRRRELKFEWWRSTAKLIVGTGEIAFANAQRPKHTFAGLDADLVFDHSLDEAAA